MGWPVIRFDEIDSTNEEARRRAQSGDAGPCWITTRVQTAGKGRLGRHWDSPSGNLFATALFNFPRPPAEAALACFSAGLAVLDAAEETGVDASALKLKWPNDVLLGPAKLAGILIETGKEHGELWMAAGFGANIGSAPEQPDRPTACLADLPRGENVTPELFLAALDRTFRIRLVSLLAEGFGPTRDAWLARAAHIGERVEVNPAGGPIAGVMAGLADDGALVLRLDNGREHYVRAGEISILG